jgi:L-alanine-DL-glutamate epimerase-like enolase superfamily enzyme
MTLREIRLKLLHPFETSMDRVTERRVLLVDANVDGVIGWGECTAGENPFYSPEDTETCWHILENYVWPALKNQEFHSAADVWKILEFIRGHNMAKGALETAIWDAEAKLKNIPLWKLLGGTQQEIPCGVSIGVKDSLDELREFRSLLDSMTNPSGWRAAVSNSYQLAVPLDSLKEFQRIVCELVGLPPGPGSPLAWSSAWPTQARGICWFGPA